MGFVKERLDKIIPLSFSDLSNAMRKNRKKVCEVEKRVYFCTRKSELMSSAEEQLIGLEKVFRGLKKLQK